MSAVPRKPCGKVWREFPVPGKSSGVWESSQPWKAKLRKRRKPSSAPWSYLPEWPGSYSTLGVFYYQTGQIAKAREVLNRFKGSNAAGGLDVNRIEQALSSAPATSSTLQRTHVDGARQQLLQLALSLADRTL